MANMIYKTCKKCFDTKQLSDFPPHKEMADGHLNTCRACRREYINKHRKTPAGMATRAKEKQYPENKKRYKQSEKGKQAIARYKKDKTREAAKNAVKYALKKGKLTKEPCFVCGCSDSQAHHSSYSKDMRLVVTWLCQTHHNELHIQHNGYKSWT
jgi:hypothetical protein